MNATQSAQRVPRRLLRTGNGFGTKVFRGISNVLRVLVFEDSAGEAGSDRVALIAFEVDDQSPEDLAIALDHLRAHPAVLDVLQVPAFGKKGRMTAHIQMLAQPEAAEQVIDACFSETATLGLRCQIVERRVLRAPPGFGRGRRAQAASEAGGTPGGRDRQSGERRSARRCAAGARAARKRGAKRKQRG